MIAPTRLVAWLWLTTLAYIAVPCGADQFKQFGDWRVHYIAFNASMLSPSLAERYGIVRGRNKGLVNISAVGVTGRGEKATVRGRFRNLLGQSRELDFRAIEDSGGSVYYLATFDFENAETLRFEIELDLPDHGAATLRFQQPLYFPVP